MKNKRYNNFNYLLFKKKLQKGGLVLKLQKGKQFQRLDIQKLVSSPGWKNFGYKLNPKNLEILQDSMEHRNMGFPQRVAILTNVIAENGGDSTPHGNGAHGLLGWRGGRQKGLGNNLPKQIHKTMEDVYNPKNYVEWTHGGKGSGANSAKQLREIFNNSSNVLKATNSFTRGYVRPSQKDVEKRNLLAKLIQSCMKYFK